MTSRSRPRIALFCEDRSHEQFVRALVRRRAREMGLRPGLHAVQARGGQGRVLTEFGIWQSSLLRRTETEVPDLIVVVQDTNCSSWHDERKRVERAIDPAVIPSAVVGCPDPHIERWYMADPDGFRSVVGVRPAADPGKCERDLYKQLLAAAIREARALVLTGPEELAPDLVAAMDLYRAGKRQPSLKNFLDELNGGLRRFAP